MEKKPAKKVLIVASVISFIEWFQKENLRMLTEKFGCEVHVACNMDYMEDTSVERTTAFVRAAEEKGVIFHSVGFDRMPLRKSNFKAFRDLKQLINDGNFSLIHCHTPMAAILCRLAAKKARRRGTCVVYTAHGYHFFTGAPIRNWVVFYPIEKYCSRLCDVLITINGEDYRRSLAKMHTPRIEYIPGVGVDADRFAAPGADRFALRRSFGIPDDAFCVLSVGELNENKNHASVIRAIASLASDDVYYLIAGKGSGAADLERTAKDCGVSDRVRLLGFRTDVADLCHAADAFAFTSFREGLPAALMEAMASGLPVVASEIRGNSDLVVPGKGGFLCRPDDISSIAAHLAAVKNDPSLRAEMAAFNRTRIRDFSSDVVREKTAALYRELLGGEEQ